MADKRQLLKRYWHYTAFRPCQEEIIDTLLQGRDVFVLMPTGGGKSICYQLPPLMMEGLCLVVTPLVALMKDQVQRLNDMHLKAACIYAGLGSTSTFAVLSNAVSGTIKYLYVSPERLQQRAFVEHFRRMKVCLLAVDEAHCVSQWGYDFRPPYLQIADIRQYHPEVPMVALTATATPTVVEDVCRRLQLRSPQVFRTSFERGNLAYIVSRTDDKQRRLLRLCQGLTEGNGIVYCATRRRTETVAAFLQANGISAVFFHAGLSSRERDQRQAAWMEGSCRVIVATSAFGMGIDKADVRFVAHCDVPSSLEAYFQEAGRAGRDGKPAKAVLLCDGTDHRRLAEAMEVAYPPVAHIRNAYRAICNYYRIPMGSGADTTVEFNADKICANYNLNPREFFACCGFLEREGLITVNDDGLTKSTLLIRANRDEIYCFLVDHPRYSNLLQCIIRQYPGILTERVSVDEHRIASRCMTDTKDVMQLLSKLNEMRVVEYTPSSETPRLTFCCERVDERSVALDTTAYDELKRAARHRLDAMLAYIGGDVVCRSRQLRNYFGEKEGVGDCGRCDVCLRRVQSATEVEQAIFQAVGQGRLTVNTLCELLAGQNYMEVEQTVRRMLDRGEIQLDRNLFLSLS